WESRWTRCAPGRRRSAWRSPVPGDGAARSITPCGGGLDSACLSRRRERSPPMNVGGSVPLPAYHVAVAPLARTAESLGFPAFWCAEHPFIPVHSTSRFPGSEDGVIPESYSHFIDPFVALARASGVTQRMKLGTGIVLVPERHPLLLAKEISTLDL